MRSEKNNHEAQFEDETGFIGCVKRVQIHKKIKIGITQNVRDFRPVQPL